MARAVAGGAALPGRSRAAGGDRPPRRDSPTGRRPGWARRESSRRRGRARSYPRCNRRVLARRSAAVYNSAVAGAPVETLKKVPLFAGLDGKELQEIANSMRERRFKAGDTVTQEGPGGVGFFVV